MIAKHIDRFPLLKLDQVIDWQPIEQYLNRQRTRYLRDHRGRPAYPLLSMFKAILLGQRHYRRCRTTVYNIEVEDYHTYCVDYQCILAHNQNLCRPAMHAVSELIADDGVAGNASNQGQ